MNTETDIKVTFCQKFHIKLVIFPPIILHLAPKHFIAWIDPYHMRMCTRANTQTCALSLLYTASPMCICIDPSMWTYKILSFFFSQSQAIFRKIRLAEYI